MRRLLATSALLILAPVLARAADVALVMGTADYGALPDLPRGTEVVEAVDGLAGLGFDVLTVEDGAVAQVSRTLADFVARVPEAERLLVVLSGRFVTDGTRTWYLTRDAAAPSLFGLDERAVPLESLLQVLARAPSRAVLLLGVDPGGQVAFDPWLREGVGALAIPQGVTVLTGAPRAAANFLADELSAPRADLSRLVAENGNIAVAGYLPQGFVFAGGPPTAASDRQDAEAEETALWQGAAALDTLDAYRNYLSAYPQGRYATQARQGIEAILAEPNREQRLAEEALDLTRDQRREIQRNLSLLDLDPRGIDGIFGPGTRRAVTDWQQQNGFAQTSYLDREQIERLAAQAARRAQQIEAEAERQREAAQVAERAYWEESGARGDEPGLRAYLERYPDGIFADTATERLARIQDENRRQAQAADRAAWDRARGADRTEAYEDYLRGYPEGRFTAEAQARLAELAQADRNAQANAQADAEERALGLNSLTARVVEQRLDVLGLRPGEVDGRFDADTRQALRAYQRDRGLPVSGYLNEPTLVRLLADTLGRALAE
ncbi:peptidoglycan-binding domain-containing protein [Rubellimicrobium arenae]|uniref:peptidoglycan-binding domain-containing protein n=1 Tax=Rubellimicrobium arenae TaxID=2817372 RepID=UPI001B30C37B|nr:peptidoglycan-binding domain-containing protein [Rubellimicrobium arenae]